MLVVAALLVGAGGMLFRSWIAGAFFFRTDTTIAPAGPIAPPQVRTTVMALGRLEPESEIINVAAAPGNRLDRVVVSEGMTVARGDPLAYLDSYAEMQAARDCAVAQLAEAKARYAAETDYGQALILEARLGLKKIKEVSQLGIDAQTADVRRYQAEVDKYQIDVVRLRKLLDSHATGQNEYDSGVLAVRIAQEQVSKAKSVVAQLENDRRVSLELADAELRSAERSLARTQALIVIDSLEQNVKVAAARLERAVIRSPIDGQVIKVLMHGGEAIGTSVASGSGILLKLGSTSSMFAVAEVYETDVQWVRPGLVATITSKAFPDRLSGRVERVGTLIYKNDVLKIDPTAESDRRVIEVRIRLDSSSLARRYNLHQVDVAIQLDSEAAPRVAATMPAF